MANSISTLLKNFLLSQKKNASLYFYAMLPEESMLEAHLFDFWNEFRKRRTFFSRKKSLTESQLELEFYTLATQRISKLLSREKDYIYGMESSKDIASLENNLLKKFEKDSGFFEKNSAEVWKRVRALEPSLRCLIFLRDVLGFSDERVMQMVGLKWGTYRHRLHMARTLFSEYLQGKSSKPYDSKAFAQTGT